MLREDLVGVLSYKVAHGARDDLEAVGVCARRDEGEVPSRTHLQNLRERDLLQGRTQMSGCTARTNESGNFRGSNEYQPCSICWRCCSAGG